MIDLSDHMLLFYIFGNGQLRGRPRNPLWMQVFCGRCRSRRRMTKSAWCSECQRRYRAAPK